MSLGDSRLRLLVVYAHYAPTLSYLDDWLDAFKATPLAEVTSFDLCGGGGPGDLEKLMADKDATVLLHSTNGDTLTYLQPFTQVFQGRSNLLASFVGNEVNAPGSPVGEKIDFLRRVAADFIFTQLLAEAGSWLYEECPTARVEAVPHALQPAVFQATIPHPERDIDIGVRTARYTAYLGDNDRNDLLDYFRDPSHTGDLVIDISTTERFGRTDWARFLNRCRATVSNEAGSWYLERDDATVNAIREYVLETERAKGGIVIAADSRFRRFGHRLPWWIRSALRELMRRGPVRHEASFNEEIGFSEIYERFFADREPAPVYSKAISSRHFDAIGTGTCQIMLRGRYNDVLVADEHYLALEPGLSNADEVLRRYEDEKERARVSSNALSLVQGAHTYEHRMKQVVELLANAR